MPLGSFYTQGKLFEGLFLDGRSGDVTYASELCGYFITPSAYGRSLSLIAVASGAAGEDVCGWRVCSTCGCSHV
jgi:hypothetical protein